MADTVLEVEASSRHVSISVQVYGLCTILFHLGVVELRLGPEN